jgi:serine/threonine protein kinase
MEAKTEKGVASVVRITYDKAIKYLELDHLYCVPEYCCMVQLYIRRAPPTLPTLRDGSILVNEKGMYVLSLQMGNYGTSLYKVELKNDSEIMILLRDISEALYFLHEISIIHRDIKLSNILWKDNKAVLIDFSHAQITPTTKQDTYMVTTSYRAPEIFNAMSYNYAVDMWGFGLVLYEKITNTCFHQYICSKFEIVADTTREQLEDLIVVYLKKFINNQEFYIAELKTEYKKHVSKRPDITLDKYYWSIIEECLRYKPESRLTSKDLYKKIHGEPFIVEPRDYSKICDFMPFNDRQRARFDIARKLTDVLCATYHSSEELRNVMYYVMWYITIFFKPAGTSIKNYTIGMFLIYSLLVDDYHISITHVVNKMIAYGVKDYDINYVIAQTYSKDTKFYHNHVVDRIQLKDISNFVKKIDEL